MSLAILTSSAFAQEESTDVQEKKTQSLVVLACTLAMAIAGIGSAIGISMGGIPAAAVTAEKPELFSRALILEMLPMTQTIYAFIASVLLLMGAGLLGGKASMDLLNPTIGQSAVFVGLMVGLTGLSAINQGMIAGAGITATGRNPSVAGRSIMFAVMPETIAIFGFLVGLLIMILGLKILG
ncbi:MAG TPA: V-type ATP synthase subunit K [Thermoplasmatales archaeon]|nr:V-type ATP synthase subunit K [Thermoplasmatales archaeon]